jgi:hypothetical protein
MWKLKLNKIDCFLLIVKYGILLRIETFDLLHVVYKIL